jgi:hypothetical protein
MGARGPKSAADLSVVPFPLEERARLEPPEDMSEIGQDLWRKIVNNLPSGWFDQASCVVLVGLIGHAIARDLLWARYERALHGIPDSELPIEILSRMYRREQAGVERAASDLRITKSTRLIRTNETERLKRKAQITARPWEG